MSRFCTEPISETAFPDGVVVDALWLVVGETRFVDVAACDEPQMVAPQVTALGGLDHAAAMFTERAVELEHDAFCSVGVRLQPSGDPLPAGAPPELAGASIVVLGRLPDDTSFVIVSRVDTEYELRASGGRFDMSETDDGVFLGFDVAAWLADLDLASGTPGVDGRIRIDADDNPDLLAAFEARIGSGLELYRDNDHDGRPDVDRGRWPGHGRRDLRWRNV